MFRNPFEKFNQIISNVWRLMQINMLSALVVVFCLIAINLITKPAYAQSRGSISFCGPNFQGACCSNTDKNGVPHPTQPWIDCKLLFRQSDANVNSSGNANKAAALGGLTSILRSMSENEDRRNQKEIEEYRRDVEALKKQAEETEKTIQAIKRDSDKQALQITEHLKNNSKPIECDCSVTQGACAATINVTSASGISGGYAAEYKITTSQACSRVDYYIDNTPNTSILSNSTVSMESSFGTSPINQSSFKIISCKACKRN